MEDVLSTQSGTRPKSNSETCGGFYRRGPCVARGRARRASGIWAAAICSGDTDVAIHYAANQVANTTSGLWLNLQRTYDLETEAAG